jgi:cystathionine beta-lyase/cystathionine gamma-synthase
MSDGLNERPKQRLATLSVHAGAPDREAGAPVVPPLVQSSTFLGGWGEEASELLYTRYGNNPNQVQVGRKLAALEGTEAALLLSSGMAAMAMTLLSRVEQGDHIVASRFLYGTTLSLLTEELPRRGIETSFIDPDKADGWSSALRENTRALVLEVPTNPTLRVFDPRVPAALAREHGILLAVDATFASPVNMRCADLGVTAVIHSATKYLGGHSDLIAGVVAGSKELVAAVQNLMKLYGPSPDPHMAWLLDRGLRTLDMRVRTQNQNALTLARFLEGRPEVEVVYYPGLPSHPDHLLASELMTGFGGMLSFVLKGGGVAADAFAGALELTAVAPSLGGVETLLSQPRFTSHLHQTPEERAALGIPDGFIRLSVGVEDARDLRADLERGLRALADPA